MKSFKTTKFDSPLVSIVILNYNGLAFLGEGLKECIDSVLETDYLNYEVILVDNGSTDESVKYIQANYGSRINLIKNKTNLGFSEGFNTGIRKSKGKYITLLSNDMTVSPNWILPIISLMELDSEIGLAGFKRMLYGEKNMIDGIGGYLNLDGRVKVVASSEEDVGQYDNIIEDLDFIGGAMVIRRKTLEDVGLFDPEYIVYSEDVDLCFRIRKKGYKVIYVPESILWHKRGRTFKGIDSSLRYSHYMSGRSRIRFAIIHFIIMRLLSTFLIDSVYLLLSGGSWKVILIKAYWWNLKNMPKTIKYRLQRGPSPFIIKHPRGFRLTSCFGSLPLG
jgi:hypothetical protein